MIHRELAENIVFNLVEDILDRSGLGDAWNSIDEESQAEICEKWVEIVLGSD